MTDGLVLVRSDEEGTTRHLVRSDMVIGHGRGTELRLREHGVQRRHAVIEHFSSGLAIRSLSSRAEVVVNGNRISRRTLRVGDQIAIGPTRFTVEESDPDPASESAGRERPTRPESSHPQDPVPPQVLARVQKPEIAPPQFAGPPMPRRRSVATHRSATFACLVIVLGDAIGLGFYLGGL